MISKDTKNNEQALHLLKSSLLGAARGLVGLPIEHPFETLKTKMQAEDTRPRPLQLIKKIYQREGIKGFYSGLIPNSVRVTIKQIYRFPMLLYLPIFLEQQSAKMMSSSDGSKKTMDSHTSKTLTGIAIAFAEVFMICPAERLKVWLMTKSDKTMNIRMFFSQKNIFQQLFKGLNLVFMKQAASWVSFLLTDDILKKKIRQYQGIKETEALNYSSLMLVSAFVGAANILAAMPFDVAKTLQQRQGAVAKGTFAVFKDAYRSGGLGRLYAGWDFRFIHYMIQSILTVNLYDYLETSYKSIVRQ